MVDYFEITICPYCKKEIDEPLTQYVCDDCGTGYDTTEEAEDCCAEVEEEEED